MSERPLALSIVLPTFSPTGGALVAYRHAQWLRSRGHAVHLFAEAPQLAFPGRPGAGLAARRWIYHRFLHRIPATLRGFGLHDVAHEMARLDAARLPDADLVMATSFETAEQVARLPARCGRPVYFLQDHEAWTPDLEPRVAATWRLPFTRLAVSRWLIELGRERYGVNCRGPIGNGVDAEYFALARNERSAPLAVGGVFQTDPRKGFDVLLEALHRIAREEPRVRFLVFGRARPRDRFPKSTRYAWSPDWGRLPGLYRQMDVFLHASRFEGWGLPPMEAMASGCALVATPTGGVPEFTDDSCAVWVPPGDAAALADAALALIGDRERRESLGRAARERMRAHGWRPVHERMERELIGARSGWR